MGVAALRRCLRMAVVAMVFVVSARAAEPPTDLGVLRGGTDAAAFAPVLGPRVFEFPRDHGPHRDFRQEWWYFTGNLDGDDGERFGFELTFFRFAMAPAGVPAAGMAAGSGDGVSGWRTRQIYVGHFAITDVGQKRFRYVQKLSRGALGLAGAEIPPLRVWVDDWAMAANDAATGADTGGVSDRVARWTGAADRSGVVGRADADVRAGVADRAAGDVARWTLHAAEAGYELTLDARPLLAPVLNGDRGFSRKSSEPGFASYYYSIPRVAVQGQLLRDGKPIKVQGLAWFDREWSSAALSAGEQGWDWFALQLKDGSCLMFYALRRRDGSRDPNSAGTWVSANGESRPLATNDVRIEVFDYWTNPRGNRYPARWRVRVPSAGLDVEVHPVLADQELTTAARYWEGAVDVTGTAAAQKAEGRGYVELVGYAAQ